MSNVSKINETDLSESEISLADVIEFIQESWKIIVGVTVLGISGAAVYLWVAPKQYEASAQIKMAQIANVINIEEPQALIARMAIPTSYPKEVIAICGLADKKDSNALLAKKVRLTITKGVNSTVDLKILSVSKETAKECVNALFQLIKSNQAELIAPFIDAARKKLAIEEQRLTRATQVIAKADSSGAAVSAAYLSTRDEVRYLLDQISNLQNVINGNENRAAHLTAPIYLSDQPALPQKRNSLFVGLLIGGFLGLALALVRKWYHSKRVTLKR